MDKIKLHNVMLKDIVDLVEKLGNADLAYVDLWDTEVGVAMPQEQWEDISETCDSIRKYLNEDPPQTQNEDGTQDSFIVKIVAGGLAFVGKVSFEEWLLKLTSAHSNKKTLFRQGMLGETEAFNEDGYIGAYYPEEVLTTYLSYVYLTPISSYTYNS